MLAISYSGRAAAAIHCLPPSIGVANAGLTGSLAATPLINPLIANNVGAQASLDGSSPPLPPTCLSNDREAS